MKRLVFSLLLGLSFIAGARVAEACDCQQKQQGCDCGGGGQSCACPGMGDAHAQAPVKKAKPDKKRDQAKR
jgi:hypothetical protein